MRINLGLIKPSPRPVRTTWDEGKLTELAESIKEQGLIVPVKVRPLNYECAKCGDFFPVAVRHCPACGHHYPDDECGNCHRLLGNVTKAKAATTAPPGWNGAIYEIVYGHRRVEAARRAGLEEIEAIVEGVDDTNALVQALIENLQREDMNPVDKANALRLLKQETGWTNRELGRRGIIGSDMASHLLNVLNQPEDIQAMVVMGTGSGIAEGQLTTEHILEVSQVQSGSAEQADVLRKAAKEGLSRRQTRHLAESIAAAPSDQAKAKLLEWEYSPTIHDPEMIKARAREYGGNDPIYHDQAPRKQKEWEQIPEVAAAVTGIIEGVKRWQSLIGEMRKMVELGKMSPESRRFVAHKVRQLSDTLAAWAEELESAVD